MSYYYRTHVPNSLFDYHLEHLGYAELKVLLVVVRQTYGWIDKATGKHKSWDWISRQFFVKKTALSKRSVSTAIAKLIDKKLILVRNKQGVLLHSKLQRQHCSKLYFTCTLENKSSEVKRHRPVKQFPPTIIKHTKMYREVSSQGLEKLKIRSFKKQDKP